MSATVAVPVYRESGQVARELGVSVEVLRLWERQGKITAPLRTAGGRRLYSERDVEALRAFRATRPSAGAAGAAA